MAQRYGPVVGAFAVVAVAWFFAGVVGIVAATVGLALIAVVGPRWVAAAGLAGLAGAAVATVTETQLSRAYGSDFAVNRPIAAEMARVAGILVLVALVGFVRRERANRVASSTGADAALAGEQRRSRLWPVAVPFGLLALVAILTNSPGHYIDEILIGDTHFDLFWDPLELLGRQRWLWDPYRGLGRTRSNFWPVPTGALSLVRELGVSAVLTQRLWHVALLTTAGVGMAAVIRLFRPRLGVEQIVAGLVYMFGAFSAAFFYPSFYFLGYALAPWFVVMIVEGVRGRRPWRWAAAFALLFFISGNLNYAALIYAMAPMVPAAIYVVGIERTGRASALFAWITRAAFLSALVSVAGLVTSHFDADVILQNLNLTEADLSVQVEVAWAESWRGMGLWFLNLHGGTPVLDFPQLASYFNSAPVILATFAVPCAAIATLFLTRGRARLLFGATMLLGVALMVGAFPPADPSPYGRLLISVFAHFESLKGFRGTFKAVPSLAIGTAGLIGLGSAGLLTALRGRKRALGVVIAAAGIAVFAAVSFPFWQGSLYRPTNKLSTIPSYWYRAAGWLDHQPGEGRVLILPSTVNAVYTWGDAADDIFDAILTRPHIAREQIDELLGTPESANLLAALDDYLHSGTYQPGTLEPIARRLGIRYILVRNDLNWKQIGRPAPATFDTLREDPGLRLVHTFGSPGENVLAGRPEDRSLPPVQVYEIPGVGPLARAVTASPLLVSGDGAAWPGLAASGLLDQTGPVRYTGDLSAGALGAELGSGSQIVITDTNRRQGRTIPGATALPSYTETLSPGEGVPDRPLDDLFHRAGSQTVAYFPDGRRVRASGSASPLAPPASWVRPANAFDGNVGTVWAVGGLVRNPDGQWVEVDLRRPTRVSDVRIVTGPGSRVITNASVVFSDGSRVPVDLRSGAATVGFRPRRTRSIRVRIDRVAGRGLAAVSIAEVTVPGLDLREFAQVPDDVFRAASKNSRLASLLGRAPISYVFERERVMRPGVLDAEVDLHRRFRAAGDREYLLRGTIRFSPYTPPSLQQALSDGQIQPFADPRPLGPNGQPNDCQDLVVNVDGAPVPVRIDADSQTAADGNPVAFVSCAPVHLGPGWHTLTNTPGTTIDSVVLASGSPLSSAPSPATADSTQRTPGRIKVRVTAPGATAVVIGESFDSSWQGTAVGRALGSPVSLDTQTGWFVDRHGTYTLSVHFAPEREYDIALAVTAFGLALCLALVIGPRRQRRLAPRRPPETGAGLEPGSRSPSS